MSDDTYAIEFDEKSGRALVDVSGAVDVAKIQNTFLDIVSNQKWQGGDHTVLYQCEHATFPGSFQFADVFDTTRTTKLVAGTGKSAILLPETDRTVKLVADFYRSIAVAKTERMIEIFYSREKAIAWLDG